MKFRNQQILTLNKENGEKQVSDPANNLDGRAAFMLDFLDLVLELVSDDIDLARNTINIR